MAVCICVCIHIHIYIYIYTAVYNTQPQLIRVRETTYLIIIIIFIIYIYICGGEGGVSFLPISGLWDTWNMLLCIFQDVDLLKHLTFGELSLFETMKYIYGYTYGYIYILYIPIYGHNGSCRPTNPPPHGLGSSPRVFFFAKKTRPGVLEHVSSGFCQLMSI